MLHQDCWCRTTALPGSNFLCSPPLKNTLQSPSNGTRNRVAAVRLTVWRAVAIRSQLWTYTLLRPLWRETDSEWQLNLGFATFSLNCHFESHTHASANWINIVSVCSHTICAYVYRAFFTGSPAHTCLVRVWKWEIRPPLQWTWTFTHQGNGWIMLLKLFFVRWKCDRGTILGRETTKSHLHISLSQAFVHISNEKYLSCARLSLTEWVQDEVEVWNKETDSSKASKWHENTLINVISYVTNNVCFTKFV